MPSIKRRHFLQATVSTLTTLGLSQTNLFQQAQGYDRALAQGKPGRKLALLVGINGYQGSIPALRGCHMDVELQWQLLVHRYGFNPKDILVLADRRFSFLDYKPKSPTRENILTAFENHLIAQATSDSTVVFHYSGHGALIKDPYPLTNLVTNIDGVKTTQPNIYSVGGTIVPIDRLTKNPEQVQDIMGRTIFLLTALLAQKTQNITLMLDSCHSGGGFRGNAFVRALSREGGGYFTPGPEELSYQQRLLAKLGWTESEFAARRQKGIAAGVAIGSAQHSELAADAPIRIQTDSGPQLFHAGALTYTLTRYLWQQPVSESIDRIFLNIAHKAYEVGKGSNTIQQPLYDTQDDRYKAEPIYLAKPTAPYAAAVVSYVVAGGQINYWMGGISTANLENNAAGTIFSVVDGQGQPIGKVEHQGQGERLTGYGKLIQGSLSAIRRGALLREEVRGLPTNLKLKVALDESLGGDLERAKALLQGTRGVELVATSQAMDLRIGRINDRYRTQFSQTQSQSNRDIIALKENSVGLMEDKLKPLSPTFGIPNESIEDAIDRLRPRLQSFLAATILRAMGGVDVASGLRGEALVVRVEEVTAGGKVGENRFVSGSQIRLAIKNFGSKDIYVGVVAIGTAGKLRVLYPYFAAEGAAEERARLAKGRELLLPENNVEFPLGSPGSLEILVFSSAKPITPALAALQEIAARGRGGVPISRGEIPPDPMMGEDAMGVMGALLGTIDRNSRSDIPVRSTVRAVDTKQFAVISTVIEVVKE